MPFSNRWVGPVMVVALHGTCSCTTWTSVNAGYGLADTPERSLVGLDVRRGLGGALHSGYVIVGARVDGNPHQFDAELHAGIMRPLRLSEKLTLAPAATFELVRVSNLRGSWYGGALGPGFGADLVWWTWTEHHDYTTGPSFGCMGGAIGYDCPRACRVRDVHRSGFSLRANAEYDMRLGSDYPRQNDWVIWITAGYTNAKSRRESECCYYDVGPVKLQDCGGWPG